MTRNTTRSISDDCQQRRHAYQRVAVVAALLLILPIDEPSGAAADAGEGMELPVDGDVVVVELAYQDADRRGFETVVAVHADGRVVVSDAGGAGDQRNRMTQTQLTGLLHEIVVEHSVFELDSGRIQQDVRDAAEQSGRPWRVSNPGVVLIRVRLRNGQHEVRCPAAEIWHERFPGVRSVAELCAVRRRLENVRAIVQLGGWDKAEELSELANAELQRAYPGATPVTAGELSMVRGRLPEPRFVQFVSAPSTSHGETLMISVFEFPDQPRRVKVAPLSAPSAR